MSWIFPALLAPALSALGSYLDKYLLVHNEKTGGIGSVIIFSSLFGALVLPIAVFMDANIWSFTTTQILILIINGCITVATLITYLYAIRESDVISVVPILQTIPIFGYILGYFILGETLDARTILGSAIIVGSAILLSIEISEASDIRFKLKSFSLAMTSALLFSISVSFLN